MDTPQELADIEKMARKPEVEVSDRALLKALEHYIRAKAEYKTIEMRRIGAILRHRKELYESLTSLWRYLHHVRNSDPPDPFTLASTK